MSILIKGMEMPTHCIDCPFMVSRDNDDCILQSDEANENFENWEQMKAGCPLIHVPDHGRLIDADALTAKFKGMGLGEHSLIERLFADGVYVMIDYAPTVIPAEEGQ